MRGGRKGSSCSKQMRKQQQQLTTLALLVVVAATIICTLNRPTGVACARFSEQAGRPSGALESSLGAGVTLSAPRSISSRSSGDDHEPQTDDDSIDRLSSSSSAPGPSSDADTSDSTGAKCIISRNPNFKHWPTVRFYTSKQDSDVNYNCSGGLNFDLNLCQPWLDDDYESYEGKTGKLKDELDLKGRLIDSGLYDGQVNTYILVHGFLATWTSNPWMCNLKDFILSNSDANVFIVDWSGGSKPALPIDYSISVADVNPVADLLAMLSQKLIDLTQQGDASKFHFIGHSLGSHISGLAGYALNGTLGRITAYDPAGFCFTNSLVSSALIGSGNKDSELQDKFGAGEESDLSEVTTSHENAELERARKTGQLHGGRTRLSQASAQFVIAIHTDITLFGTKENMGHVDVFMNGGSSQPGCPTNTLTGRIDSILQHDFSDVFNFKISCSHSYSHDQWNSWSPLGMTPRVDHTYDPICYPMAYQCRSWAAYKAGECGMCSDWDPQCAYLGYSSHFQSVSLDPDSPDAALDANSHSMVNFYDTDDDNRADDYDANEDDSANNDDPMGSDLSSAIRNATSELSFGSQSRHFVKTSDKSPSCMYHYQILIGTRKAIPNSIFYVQLPLDEDRKRFRQARVSHLIRQNTNGHKSIVKGLQTLYSGKNDTTNNNIRNNNDESDKSNYGSFSVQRLETLNYYSALITFASLTSQECSNSRVPYQDESSGHWQACEPLRFLNGTRLKAETAQELNTVELVAINYMSGLSLKSRRAFSHLLNADSSQGIQAQE